MIAVKIIARTSKEVITESIETFLALRKKFTQEKMEAMAQYFSRCDAFNNEPTESAKRELMESKFMFDLEDTIVAHIDTRIQEYIGVDVVESVIKFGVLKFDAFPTKLSIFIASQLWGTDKSTMTAEEGRKYIQEKLKNASKEDYQVELATIEVQGFVLVLPKITNKTFRDERTAQSTSGQEKSDASEHSEIDDILGKNLLSFNLKKGGEYMN